MHRLSNTFCAPVLASKSVSISQFLTLLYTHKHHLNTLLLYQKDTVLQIDLLREVHFTGDGGENETFLPAVGQGELNLPVQTTRT